MNPMARIREQAGESQYQTARRIGIAQSTYAQIEIGSRRPSVATAKRIGAVMGFDWPMLFDDVDPKGDGSA